MVSTKPLTTVVEVGSKSNVSAAFKFVKNRAQMPIRKTVTFFMSTVLVSNIVFI